jgi:catechol 2,3-dioxygenase-like lactoylglutathione lyase family enzyme
MLNQRARADLGAKFPLTADPIPRLNLDKPGLTDEQGAKLKFTLRRLSRIERDRRTKERSMILEHIGVTANDLAESIRFYTQVFGFTVLRQTTHNAYLYLDDQLLELMQSSAPNDPHTPQTAEGWDERMRSTSGLVHIGFRVDDLEKAIQKIEQLGGRLVVPPYEFEPKIEYVGEATTDKLRRARRPAGKAYWRIAMFADPDGVILELLER